MGNLSGRRPLAFIHSRLSTDDRYRYADGTRGHERSERLLNWKGHMERPIITVQQHILDEQQNFPGVSGEFSSLLSWITLAPKMIQANVRRAGLSSILGSEAQVNVEGEIQQKLDIYANNALLHCLGVRDSVGVLASEENEQPVTLRASPRAKYAIVF